MQSDVSRIELPHYVVSSSGLSSASQPTRPSDAGSAALNDGPSKSDDAVLPRLSQLHRAVAELFNAVADTVQAEHESALECLERAGALLGLQSQGARTGVLRRSRRVDALTRGGLAPWQIREVTTYIETNLESTITVKHLATLVRLSPFYFSRAFKVSFGDSPHGYLMRRRVQHAQGLLLSSNVPLGQIAAACGLADQAHFNKLFLRFVGENPGAWRRARAIAPRD